MSNEVIKEFANKQRMRSIEMIPDNAVEIIEAPIFGLDKWRREHGLISPAMEAYVEAVREQKLLLVVGTILITVIVNYLRYGVP